MHMSYNLIEKVSYRSSNAIQVLNEALQSYTLLLDHSKGNSNTCARKQYFLWL